MEYLENSWMNITLIFHTIENDYTDGFMLFLIIWCENTLDYTDCHGRTPF